MKGLPAKLLAAFALTVASSWVTPATDERAMYGYEGPLEQNWLPREVAGWPAPFLADDPGTSVIHKVSFVEDDFRPGSFIATFSFWFLAAAAIAQALRWIRARRNN